MGVVCHSLSAHSFVGSVFNCSALFCVYRRSWCVAASVGLSQAVLLCNRWRFDFHSNLAPLVLSSIVTSSVWLQQRVNLALIGFAVAAPPPPFLAIIATTERQCIYIHSQFFAIYARAMAKSTAQFKALIFTPSARLTQSLSSNSLTDI